MGLVRSRVHLMYRLFHHHRGTYPAEVRFCVPAVAFRPPWDLPKDHISFLVASSPGIVLHHPEVGADLHLHPVPSDLSVHASGFPFVRTDLVRHLRGFHLARDHPVAYPEEELSFYPAAASKEECFHLSVHPDWAVRGFVAVASASLLVAMLRHDHHHPVHPAEFYLSAVGLRGTASLFVPLRRTDTPEAPLRIREATCHRDRLR